jgi:hypothetical protein
MNKDSLFATSCYITRDEYEEALQAALEEGITRFDKRERRMVFRLPW